VLRSGECATEEGIVSWARERMALYKVPRVIEFAASLPRTASGKSSGGCCRELKRKISELAILRPEAKLICCLSRQQMIPDMNLLTRRS
jgi:AMP-binding enzyme C-terminal domain